MTSEEVEASQSGEDGMGGPGAPTPLSALEVCYQVYLFSLPSSSLINRSGRRGSHKEGHSNDCRWWIQYRGVRRIHSEENSGANQRHLGAESDKDFDGRCVAACFNRRPLGPF
jgi:hypothetical protein